MTKSKFFFLIALMLFCFNTAFAAYQIELIIFDQQTARIPPQEFETSYPLLPESSLALTRQAQRITKRLGFPIVLHIAWEQEILSGTTPPMLIESDLFTTTILLTAKKYLQLDMITQFQDQTFKQKRRLQEDKLYYLDNPDLGALIMIKNIDE